VPEEACSIWSTGKPNLISKLKEYPDSASVTPPVDVTNCSSLAKTYDADYIDAYRQHVIDRFVPDLFVHVDSGPGVEALTMALDNPTSPLQTNGYVQSGNFGYDVQQGLFQNLQATYNMTTSFTIPSKSIPGSINCDDLETTLGVCSSIC
jgi:opacity protein-like surface antigen